ncbi:MAG: hypothetical protein H7Y09_09445 [Chitinophagaceae bacterium]|nr:hypothetical protein [Anaerolineae bacterium]
MRPLQPLQSVLTFSDYFRLNIDVDAVLEYLGYSYESKIINLPRTTQLISWSQALHDRLNATLPNVILTSETARREFLIAPVLAELAGHLAVKIRVEYALDAGEHLRGTVDYFLQAEHNLLVIEAKNADLQRGFTQLAAELVALDQLMEHPTPLLYGAVSIGNVWQFGVLDRTKKQITQDINVYAVPTELNELLLILVGILTNLPLAS